MVVEDSLYSKLNNGADISDFPRDYSVCGHSILKEDGTLVINNLQEDSRFCDNPMLTQATGMRFYAAKVLYSNKDIPIGTFCVMDAFPRDFSKKELDTLHFFSDKCMELLNLAKTHSKEKNKPNSPLLLNTKKHLINSILHYKTKCLKKEMSENSSMEECTELNLINQYLKLEDIQEKRKFSLEELFYKSVGGLDKVKKIVSLDKDEEIYGAQPLLEQVLSYVLAFTANKNSFNKIEISSIKSEYQTMIIVKSSNGGFDKSEQRRLFSLNMETASSCNPENGMGLPLSKKIIQLHNGSLQVYSAENAGLSFFISLPNS